jgi:hypothetical protein
MIDGTKKPPGESLATLVIQATRDPFYMANRLALHRLALGLTEAGQRQLLGVRAEDWELFQLCPAPAPAQWEAELTLLCDRFGVDRQTIDQALRMVQ